MSETESGYEALREAIGEYAPAPSLLTPDLTSLAESQGPASYTPGFFVAPGPY